MDKGAEHVEVARNLMNQTRELRWLFIFMIINISVISYLVIIFGRVSNNYETSWPKW